MRYGWMVAAAALVLGGAAQAQSLVKDVPPEQIGYLLATIGMVKTEDPRISFGFSLCDQEKREIAIVRYVTNQTIARKLDFEDGDFVGAVVSVALPAGTYRICKTEMFRLDRHFKPLKPENLAIPLVIEAGKANYIGRYKLAPKFVENFLGHPQLKDAQWLVANKWTEDGRAFIEQTPHAATLPPVLAMPAAALMRGTPFRHAE